MGSTTLQYEKEKNMTLFKQIAFLVSSIIVTILVTTLVLNFQTATNSMNERLYTDAKNTASSLSLSLGSANADLSTMSTMMNANFDNGNYNYISLRDTDEELLYERKKERKETTVPQWFLELIELKAPTASANVSAGWSQVGILQVQSNQEYAYRELYTIFKNLFLSFGFIAFIALILLNILLAFILKPLKKVQLQAEAVTHNQFITQEEIPHTKEFEEVVIAMNNMVHKLKIIFDKGNEELKQLRELEYIDQVTQLKNRKYLINKLPHYLKIDASSKGGVSMMISLSGMMEANNKIGHQKVNELFLEIADIFREYTGKFEDAILSRVNGTEFCIVLPECSCEEALSLANEIEKNTKKSIISMHLDSKITHLYLGLYEYHYKENISQLLSYSDNALAQAKESKNHIYLESGERIVEVMGKGAWRDTINKALQTDNFGFVPYKVMDSLSKELMHNVLSIVLHIDKEKTYSYGQFMATASQLKLSHKIYNHTLKILFTQPHQEFKEKVFSFRLSYHYLKKRDNFIFLEKLLQSHILDLSFHLIIEIPDKFAYLHIKDTKNYKDLFDKYNIQIGIYEFINEGTDYKYLQNLRPAYIKAESDYFLTQNEQTLSAIRLLTDTLDIALISTGVMDNETLTKLNKKDIYIVQGKVTDLG